jgi:hypothetical protein
LLVMFKILLSGLITIIVLGNDLLGTWVHEKDSKAGIIITDTMYYRVYDGKKIDSTHYQRDTITCDTNFAKANYKGDFLWLVENDMCFEILGLSDSILSVQYSTGRLHLYRKVK